MMHGRLVEISGVTKTYRKGGREIIVLRNLTLLVNQGEYVAIMGASGSGKSTLLHILGCLDRPTTGRYLFNGREMSMLSDLHLSHVRACDIGFIFQSFYLLPQLSVFENVELPFLYAPRPPENIREQITMALAQVGLSDRHEHRPSELSGGEMQRVAIARALVARPKLILADEPTGSLDSVTGKEILVLLQQLNEAGTTILVVTHDLDVARRAERTLILKDGSFTN